MISLVIIPADGRAHRAALQGRYHNRRYAALATELGSRSPRSALSDGPRLPCNPPRLRSTSES
jgi:hypothetical protein